jgi:hypothetical protein
MDMERKSMTAALVNVTPELAKHWLAKKHPQQVKRYSENVTLGYAAQMGTGSWDSNHPQGIVISADGYLLDGQHRLEAIVLHGRPIAMMVIQGADKEAYKHIDAGFPRSLGFRANRDLSDMAVYSMLINLCSYGGAKVRTTVEQVDICAEFIDPYLNIFKASTSRIRRARINPAALRTACVLRLKANEEYSDEICGAYSAYLSGNFQAAPRSMSILYRRMTESYNPPLHVFALAWKAFDPAKFSAIAFKLVNISEDIKTLQKTTLSELMFALWH